MGDRTGYFAQVHNSVCMGQFSLPRSQRFLRLFPIMQIYDASVPSEDAPLPIAQRQSARYAPSIHAVGTASAAKLELKRNSLRDGNRPGIGHGIPFVRVNQ